MNICWIYFFKMLRLLTLIIATIIIFRYVIQGKSMIINDWLIIMILYLGASLKSNAHDSIGKMVLWNFANRNFANGISPMSIFWWNFEKFRNSTGISTILSNLHYCPNSYGIMTIMIINVNFIVHFPLEIRQRLSLMNILLPNFHRRFDNIHKLQLLC